MVERQTKYVIIKKLRRSTKKEVIKEMVESLKGYEVMSITSDNGSEFAGMRNIGRVLKCLAYRCHPYCSWEKGGNENMNGLIRWFISKGGSIQDYSEEYIEAIANKLNRMPRKKLVYQTASELFASQVKIRKL